MRIGPRHDVGCVNINMNNEALPWVNEIRYVGIYIVRSRKLKCYPDNDAKRSFQRSVNSVNWEEVLPMT